MASRDNQIRELIERWAKAVRKEDMDGVVADHAPDMLMFDVPPPNTSRGSTPIARPGRPFSTRSGDRAYSRSSGSM